jgi:chemotaxis protein CheD
MSMTTIAEVPVTTTVGMGQAVVVENPHRLSAVLGSCVGVVLYHPRLQIGALGHVVLPDSSGRSGAAVKFADSAIPHMLALLEKRGVHSSGIVAKILGGSCMFGNGGPMQIGEANIKATTKKLEEVGINIVGRDLGGTSGRRILFDAATGHVKIDSVGLPTRII